MFRTVDVVIYLKGLVIVIITSLIVAIAINSIKNSRGYLDASLAKEYFEVTKINASHYPNIRVSGYSIDENSKYVNIKFDVSNKLSLYNYTSENIKSFCTQAYSQYFAGVSIFVDSYSKSNAFISINSEKC